MQMVAVNGKQKTDTHISRRVSAPATSAAIWLWLRLAVRKSCKPSANALHAAQSTEQSRGMNTVFTNLIPHDRSLERASNATPDLASPEATESRRLRLVAARAQRATRLAELMQARSIRSRVRIRTESEVYAELNNLIAALDAPAGSVMERWKLALVEVATDLDNELVPQPYSETGTELRGEYDNGTVGVRGRGV